MFLVRFGWQISATGPRNNPILDSIKDDEKLSNEFEKNLFSSSVLVENNLRWPFNIVDVLLSICTG